MKLCNDTLNGKLTVTGINTISFALLTSEFFIRDDNSESSSIIEDVIFEWDNPEIGYPLTMENMKKWKHYLETGDYNFNPDDLKR